MLARMILISLYYLFVWAVALVVVLIAAALFIELIYQLAVAGFRGVS